MFGVGVICAPVVGAIILREEAEANLRRELGRAPSENEVRHRLGYPLLVGRAEIPLFCVATGGGGGVAIPGTPYRISVGRSGDTLRIELQEVEVEDRQPLGNAG